MWLGVGQGHVWVGVVSCGQWVWLGVEQCNGRGKGCGKVGVAL